MSSYLFIDVGLLESVVETPGVEAIEKLCARARETGIESRSEREYKR
jgi:hypothetical protein